MKFFYKKDIIPLMLRGDAIDVQWGSRPKWKQIHGQINMDVTKK